MKSILVPVANRPECILALEAAFTLAKGLNADVTGCHIRPDKTKGKSVSLGKDDLTSLFGQSTSWEELSAADAKTATVEAKQLFERLADEKGYPVKKRVGKGDNRSAMWAELLGSPTKLMPITGPQHDLLVVSRPKAKGGKKAAVIMMQAILNSQRPVLLLPQTKKKIAGKRLAIAWNGGAFEARTLQTVLPLLAQAEDVVFLTAGNDHKSGPKAANMVKYLKHHEINARTATVKKAGKAIGQALVDSAKAEGAEILIAGAYSKGRLFETVFGGVSEYLIHKTDFPVLLMHH